MQVSHFFVKKIFNKLNNSFFSLIAKQIFPTIPRHHFHKVQPIIQALCEKYKIPYHKTTFLEGTMEVFGTLNTVSHVASKKY